ncbi:MAG: TatD family hydrolase [Clostridia bacterium]|nr:TatD family hydrolase [Clostridia bacterium]
MEFFDSHAHYNDEKFDEDRTDILGKIKEAGITKIVVAGYNVESSKEAILIAEKNDWIYATCGVSPNDITDNLDDEIARIKELCNLSKKVVAVGEIGLDYYWNKENKEKQRDYFIKQIELANEMELPIVIHSRDAYIDTIEILKQNPCVKKGVFHCCQPNHELVKEALEMGYYISFAGPCTFKNAKNSLDIIAQVPTDKMLIETDSPYLAPEPVRGTRNDSRNVIRVAEKIAEIKDIPLEKIAKITYENAKRIFNIK